MTEKDWLTKTNPMPMVRFLRGKTSDRKLRLFAVACCWRSCSYLTDEWSRNTVGVAEREADGFADQAASMFEVAGFWIWRWGRSDRP
jgi:hypothetical protein